MNVKIIRTSCDVCQKEISLNPNEDNIHNYKWGRVFHNGRNYDLCPEHFDKAKEINSRCENEMSKLLERK